MWTRLVGTALAVAGASTAAAEGYRTENVVIAVMDGTAWRATFGDPEHRYIPRLWNELRPQATLYTRFYNDDVTITKAGHSTIATGTWQKVRNRGPRQTQPTIFDYLADERKITPEGAWVIFGKGPYAYEPTTSFPAYLGRFKPSSEIGIGESSLQHDSDVFAKVQDVMRKDRPRIVFANFGSTDHLAHSGSWENHVKAIRHQDDLLVRLWEQVQADPHYRDRTTLFVTNDHGYHLDGIHEGFAEHGDSCLGCRQIMLLVVGPDIRKGAVVERPAYQRDIAPTVGELLGVQTPLAHGVVLADCLVNPRGLNGKRAVTDIAKQAVRIEKLAAGDLVKSMADEVLSARKGSGAALEPSASTAMLLWGMLAAYDKTGDERYRELARSWANERLAATGEAAAYAGLVLAELSYRLPDGAERSRALEAAGRIAVETSKRLDPARRWTTPEEPALSVVFLASLAEAIRDRTLWEKAQDFLIASIRAADLETATSAAVGLQGGPAAGASGDDVIRPEGKVVPTRAKSSSHDNSWTLLALAALRSHGLPFKGEFFEDVPELRGEVALQSAFAVQQLDVGEIWPETLRAAVSVAAIKQLQRRKDTFKRLDELTAFDLVRLRPRSPELLPQLDELKKQVRKISATNYNVEYGLPAYQDFDYTIDLLRLYAEQARTDLEKGAFLLALDRARRIPFEPQFRASPEPGPR